MGGIHTKISMKADAHHKGKPPVVLEGFILSALNLISTKEGRSEVPAYLVHLLCPKELFLSLTRDHQTQVVPGIM